MNPCAAPRSSTRVAGTGPFARTSVRRVFRRAFTAALPSCGLVSSIGGGRPALNRLNMSLAIIVTFWLVHRNCRDHTSWPVDLVGVDIVGVDRDRFAVMFDTSLSRLIVISKRAPAAAASAPVLASASNVLIDIDDVPCVAAGVPHDFAENRRSVDDLDLRALSLGGAGAQPAEFCRPRPARPAGHSRPVPPILRC